MANIFGGVEPPAWLVKASHVGETPKLAGFLGTLGAGVMQGLGRKEGVEDDPNKSGVHNWLDTRKGLFQGYQEARMTQADPLWRLGVAKTQAELAGLGARMEYERAQAESARSLALERTSRMNAYATDIPKAMPWLSATREQRLNGSVKLPEGITSVDVADMIQKTRDRDAMTEQQLALGTMRAQTSLELQGMKNLVEQMKGEINLIKTATDLQKAREVIQGRQGVADTQAQSRLDAAQIGAESREAVAGIGAESREKVAGIGAESREKVASIGAQSRESVALINAERVVEAARINAASRVEAAGVTGASRVSVAEIAAGTRGTAAQSQQINVWLKKKAELNKSWPEIRQMTAEDIKLKDPKSRTPQEHRTLKAYLDYRAESGVLDEMIGDLIEKTATGPKRPVTPGQPAGAVTTPVAPAAAGTNAPAASGGIKILSIRPKTTGVPTGSLRAVELPAAATAAAQSATPTTTTPAAKPPEVGEVRVGYGGSWVWSGSRWETAPTRASVGDTAYLGGAMAFTGSKWEPFATVKPGWETHYDKSRGGYYKVGDYEDDSSRSLAGNRLKWDNKTPLAPVNQSDRRVGKTYWTSAGPLRWNGEGWDKLK